MSRSDAIERAQRDLDVSVRQFVSSLLIFLLLLSNSKVIGVVVSAGSSSNSVHRRAVVRRFSERLIGVETID